MDILIIPWDRSGRLCKFLQRYIFELKSKTRIILALIVIGSLMAWLVRGFLPQGELFDQVSELTACQIALKSPPLSEIHEYVAGKRTPKFRATGFGKLFDKKLDKLDCNQSEIIAYFKHHRAAYAYVSLDNNTRVRVKFRPRSTGILEWIGWRIWPIKITLIFDEDNLFLRSNWGISP